MRMHDERDGRLKDSSTWQAFALNHIDSVTVVFTTLVLSLALYIHLGVAFPLIYTADKRAIAHPSKAAFSPLKCHTRAYLNRSLLLGDSCPCWDGKFRGTYSIAGPRSVMFNVQGESLGIFTLTVFFVALTMMGFRKFCDMLLSARLRWGAVWPILANAHGVYYHWWVSFNYLNESWYQYWYSQWIFGATECAVMYVLFLRLDVRFKLEQSHVTTVLAIAMFHIVQGLMTQALINVLYWRGIDIILRDLFFVLGDIVCVAVVVQEMRISARRCHQSVMQHYPKLLRNVCIGFAAMWVMLSATTFEEKPEAPSIFADD